MTSVNRITPPLSRRQTLGISVEKPFPVCVSSCPSEDFSLSVGHKVEKGQGDRFRCLGNIRHSNLSKVGGVAATTLAERAGGVESPAQPSRVQP